MIPRLTGRAKAAMVAVEFDEFGGGHPARAHARPFAAAPRNVAYRVALMGGTPRRAKAIGWSCKMNPRP